MNKKQLTTRRLTAAELLTSNRTERPMPAYACPLDGIIGCSRDMHEPGPRPTRDPGAMFLRAVAG